MEYEGDVHFTAHEHVYERGEPVYRYRMCPNSTSRHWLEEQRYVDPACTLYVVSGSAGSTEVCPSKWLRQPSWGHPSLTNILGFVNVAYEDRAEPAFRGSTLHMAYVAAAERLLGEVSSFPSDQFAIVHAPAGQRARRAVVQRLLGGAGSELIV